MPSISDKIASFNQTVFRDRRHRELFEKWQNDLITYEEYLAKRKNLVDEQADEFWQEELFPKK
jgi:hypothetical protein